MQGKRLLLLELLAIIVFLGASLAFLFDVTFGDKVLLPTDNLFRMQPWKALAESYGAYVPHNELISDMILQNIFWKRFSARSLWEGTIPLWNPFTFSGTPFLAAGQQAVFYPPGILFYIMPVERAYGWFTALHLFLGAAFAYTFLRVLGSGRIGGIIAGLAFAFSGFIVVSFLWPMVVSGVIWLPLLLAFVELIVREREREASTRVLLTALYITGGSLALGLQILAGHAEFTFYTLFTLLFYAAARLLMSLRQTGTLSRTIQSGLALAGMVAIGLAIAGVQLVPFYEVAQQNYRVGGTTYDEVVGYALPVRQALVFVVPDFYGNPTHHDYFDVFEWKTLPVPDNFYGSPTSPPHTVFWGAKNYIEAAGYVGILPLFLALIAVVFRRSRPVVIFGIYALLSFLLILGTPLYAVFYSGIPGFEQLRTPFRWIYPYSLSIAVLAGLGADWLSARSQSTGTRNSTGVESSLESTYQRWLVRWIGPVTAALGLLLLATLALSLLVRDRVAALAESALVRSSALASAFGSGEMLYSYQLRNLILFAILILSSGLVIWLAMAGHRRRAWVPLAVLLLVADLGVFGIGFNSRTDARLLEVQPPSIEFLQSDDSVFRVVSFGDEDVLPPNTGALYGLHDTRGYDSLIPRQYVEYWSLIEPPQGLPYNRIHKLVREESLDSSLLDLLNVKYVLTTIPLNRQGLQLAYEGEILIYERTGVMPRAFVVAAGRFTPDGEATLRQLGRSDFDPRREVILEGGGDATAAGEAAWVSGQIVSYGSDRVEVIIDTAEGGYLVLTDSYFEGWQATVDGEPVPVYRANHNFRAVPVGPGEQRVVFRYSPLSFRIGLFASALGVLMAGLLAAVSLWPLVSGGSEVSTVRRIGRNSITPMATSLLNKVVDMGFAMLMLRLLGPEENGKFYVAIVFISYFDIMTNFGLNALVIREVARAPEARHRYLTGALAIRLGLWVLAVPILIGVLWVNPEVLGLTEGSVRVAALLGLALLPSSVSAAFSSLFYAFERMEYPAVISIIVNLIRVSLGIAVLLLGWGIVGIAGVAVVVTIVNATVFGWLAARVLGRPRWELQPSLIPSMMKDSFPLMLNHFLATLFFKIDVLMLQRILGATVVGFYGTAYKFVDGLQVIPSSFVFAIFPLMSRYAESSGESLHRTYMVALRLLLAVALPVAVVTTVFADELILLLGGPQYLPHSAVALRVIIWFLPFSFVNGVTQYVLVAVGQQRFITISFVLAATFNVVANALAIPRYGYVGAASVTILSELVLMGPFVYCVTRHVGPLPLVSLLARPTLSAGPAAAILLLARWGGYYALAPLAIVAYAGLLLALGGIGHEERALLWRQLEPRLIRLFRVRHSSLTNELPSDTV